jgi:capsular polysaccharide biosynthesis protein
MSQPLQHTVSITDVAEEITVLETCLPISARFAGDPDRIGRDRRMNPFLDWETMPATIRVYRLRDVVLDRSLMVLLKDGRVIAETNYLQPEAAIAEARVDPDRLVRLDSGNAVAACFDHWDANYYHWMAHTAPTVQAIQQHHPTLDISLALPRLHPWQRKSLELLGAADLPSITAEPGRQYLIELAEYYDFVTGRADFAVSLISHSAYTRMSAGVKTTPPQHRRIYIDRSGQTNRRLPNEPALLVALRQRDFHLVRPEQLCLGEQIALFRGANMVVGQLGAGLTNIAFCQPGTVVYELVPDHHRNPCFLAMALQGGLQYWADVFPTGVIGGDHTSAWAADIDIDHVLARIDELVPLIPPAGCAAR